MLCVVGQAAAPITLHRVSIGTKWMDGFCISKGDYNVCVSAFVCNYSSSNAITQHDAPARARIIFHESESVYFNQVPISKIWFYLLMF